MKRRHLFQSVLTLALTTAMIAGCGQAAGTTATTATTAAATTAASSAAATTAAASESAAAGGTVEITFMNSKGEIQAQLEETAKAFMTDHPEIKLSVIPCPSGTSPFQNLSTLYNSGNAPALAMVDPGDVSRLKDNFLVLNDEKWMADAVDGATKAFTVEGSTYAFPFTIEGFSLIYNKAVLDTAFGGTFDPTTITTRTALKDAFDKVVASGKKAVVVAPLDWSLGAHMFSLSYITEGKGDQAAYDTTFANLKAGKTDLMNTPSFTNWLDTFDLLKSYNSGKADPLSLTYEQCAEVLAKGEVGFWYMGNWAWPNIKSFDATGDYGFVPFPTSDTASDYGNDKIIAFPSKCIGVDKTQNSTEQQAAAKTFLNWLVYEQKGQESLVNTCSLIPAFNNITIPVADPLGKSIVAHMADGMTMNAIDAYTSMPADHWSKVGASFQKYLSDNTDRAGLAKEIQDYWTTVK